MKQEVVVLSPQELEELVDRSVRRVVEQLRGHLLKASGECETVEGIAARFGIPKGVWDAMRRRGEGPAYIKNGKTLVYRIGDVQDWLNRNRFEPELL